MPLCLHIPVRARGDIHGKAAHKQCPAKAALLNKTWCPHGSSSALHSRLGWTRRHFSPTSPSESGPPSSGLLLRWRSVSRATQPGWPSPHHATEGAPKSLALATRRRGHHPVPSGGVCAPVLPRCRQQVEYCRCGRLKCRRHNGGLCPIRHARAPLWKAHTRGDTALAPAIIPAA